MLRDMACPRGGKSVACSGLPGEGTESVLMKNPVQKAVITSVYRKSNM